jgi:hypothetical protein
MRTAFLFLAALAVAARLAPVQAQDAAVTVLAAGDIARCSKPWWAKPLGALWDARGAPLTAELLDRLPGTVLALGDLVYDADTVEAYRDCYDATWGRHRERTRPVPGNHDYRSDGAAYFAYWRARAGTAGQGYYSFDLGAWHVIALNSNIDTGAASEQARWLRADLAATRAHCILAYWHHPLFTSGKHHGKEAKAAPLYRLLYEAGASVALAGHGHNYERFAPQDADGRLDPERGIRSFVVGTGGVPLRGIARRSENSEAFYSENWGVLELTLHDGSYAWRFVPVTGDASPDAGAAPCVQRRSN